MTTEPIPPARSLRTVVEDAYTGQERLSRDELRRRCVAAELTADDMTRIDALPEGEYAEDEAIEALQSMNTLFQR